MRLGLVAVLVMLSLLPTVAAQVPTPPEPEAIVLLACDTVGSVEPQARELLPVCVAQEPPAPAGANEDAAPPAPAKRETVSPEAAGDLAADVLDKIDDIPEDPAGAPKALQAVLSIVLDFVMRLLEIPALVGDAIATAARALGDATAAAGAAMAGATTGTLEAIQSAACAVGDAIASLFDAPAAAPGDAPMLPKSAPVKVPSHELPLGEVRQLLAEA